MKTVFRLMLVLALSLAAITSASAAGQYHEVTYPPSAQAGELQLGVTYTIWIPDGVAKLRGVIVHQHGCGSGACKGGETAAYDLHWQALAKKWDCALLGPSYHQDDKQNCRLWCDPRNGSAKSFIKALGELAAKSKHPELESVPWCLWGHSGGGFWASLIQTAYPDRIVAIWFRSGTAYAAWEKGDIAKPEISPAAYAIPMMCNPGAKENGDKRFDGAWTGSMAMFKAYRAKGAPIGFAPDPRTSHECGDSRYLAIPFFDACLALRLPDKGSKDQKLKSVDLKTGWLAPLLGDKAEAATSFGGKADEAVWLPNESVAQAWMEYVKSGAAGDTTPPPAPFGVKVSVQADKSVAVTWDAEADFESGLQGFVIQRDGKDLAQVPEKPAGRFGRPLFQSMSYHDTPEKPLLAMRCVDRDAKAGTKHEYRVIAINSVGLKSAPSQPGLVAAEAGSTPNTWTKLDKATIEGRRWDVPVGYSPELKRFLVLGGRITFADAKKPRSYDQLALDLKEGRWENWYPKGKGWGPKLGPCQPPAWKNEVWNFQDAEGNVRPNWTVYGTFSLGQKYDYDPDTQSFVFYANGKTFRFDPVERQWTDLAPKTDPEKELGGILLWSSMCYDRQNKRFLLFGGGNIQTERGDPGTWTYTPASNTWSQLKLAIQPPQRANSRLCYDPVNKKVVLFGGDQLDQLLADTWTFDVVNQKWEQKKPARSPSPRAGHSLLWLPKSKKVLLLGGYGYTSAVGYVESLYRRLPLEAWTYDAAADRWDLIQRFGGKEIPEGPANFFVSATVDEEDNVLVVGSNGTWLCRLDASKSDADGTAKLGVAPGAVERRTGPHDPAWYKEGVPAADPAKVEAELKDLPANQWVQRPTPKLPRPNMDWGSAVFAPELDLIMRFSGGHSAYSGTAPQVYDVKTDRYTIPFVPEYPIEYVYSNDQVHGEWSFKGNPWMTGHTYKSTGYDPHLKCLVFAPHEYLYVFDPKTGKWSRNNERNPYRPNMYVVTLCPTPQGVVAWADKREGNAGLWRLDASSKTWKALPLTGTLPAKSADQHGMAYDAKRDRLLFFSNADKNKGDVAAYDFKTGEAKWLGAAGKEKAAVQSRETIYVPELDAVLIGARVTGDGKQLWALYDCGKNAWFGVELPGADPIGKGTFGTSFNNSMGLMFDPNRKLVWAVGQNSHVHVLRLEAKSLKVQELK